MKHLSQLLFYWEIEQGSTKLHRLTAKQYTMIEAMCTHFGNHTGKWAKSASYVNRLQEFQGWLLPNDPDAGDWHMKYNWCQRPFGCVMPNTTSTPHIFRVAVSKLRFRSCLTLLVVLRIYVALMIFQPYHDLEAGDNLWNPSDETGNRTPDLLLSNPRA